MNDYENDDPCTAPRAVAMSRDEVLRFKGENSALESELRASRQAPIPSFEAIQDLKRALAASGPAEIAASWQRLVAVMRDDLAGVVLSERPLGLHFFAQEGDSMLPVGSVGAEQSLLSVRRSIAGCALRGLEVYWNGQQNSTSVIRAWLASGEPIGTYDSRTSLLSVLGRTCRFEITPTSEEKVGLLCAPAGSDYYSPDADVGVVACLELQMAPEDSPLCGEGVRERLRTILVHLPIAELLPGLELARASS